AQGNGHRQRVADAQEHPLRRQPAGTGGARPVVTVGPAACDGRGERVPSRPWTTWPASWPPPATTPAPPTGCCPWSSPSCAASAARLVTLRYFAGLTHQEAAEALGVTRRAADRLWALARAWLYQRLTDG